MSNNRRIFLNIFWIVLGTILIITSKMEMIGDIYIGFGGGLIGVGVVQLFRNIKYRTNKEYKEQVDVEIGDERNRYIRMKAWSWTGYFSVIILGLITIICMVFSQMLYMKISSYALCIVLMLYWVSYVIIKRKN